tara:strand:+ start:724 stop:2112 length:1389 start_codon:yes stop_codon:yes gene_type:complete
MKTAKLSQEEVFEQIRLKCREDGFVHALAELSFEDSFFTIYLDKGVNLLDIKEKRGDGNFVRYELSLLIGCLAQAPIIQNIPSRHNLDKLKKEICELLPLLHNGFKDALNEKIMESITSIEQGADPRDADPLKSMEVMQEAIFYGGDAACIFQYDNWIIEKYENDAVWFEKGIGSSLKDYVKVINCIAHHAKENANRSSPSGDTDFTATNTALDIFKFSRQLICQNTSVAQSIVDKILEKFTLGTLPENSNFSGPVAPNEASFKPIMQLSKNEFVMFDSYGLLEAAYDAPFYWMQNDKVYKNTASINRGHFAEQKSYEMLCRVFGKKNVHKNVKILSESKKDTLAEIDVLVVFAGRLIVLEAKSKKLTLKAKLGDKEAFSEDFKNAIQDAYDQSQKAIERIQEPNICVSLEDGDTLKLPDSFIEIYNLCVLANFYPALLPQVSQFLVIHEGKHPHWLPIFFS